jgi:hypothetical protein
MRAGLRGGFAAEFPWRATWGNATGGARDKEYILNGFMMQSLQL